jgi:hypothetical protein
MRHALLGLEGSEVETAGSGAGCRVRIYTDKMYELAQAQYRDVPKVDSWVELAHELDKR